MANDLMGINEENLNKVILDIYDYAEKISDVLNKIDDTMNKVSSSFDCESGRKLDRKFNDLKENFPIIKENVLVYAQDLIKAKSNYNDFNLELSTRITKDVNNLDIR